MPESNLEFKIRFITFIQYPANGSFEHFIRESYEIVSNIIMPLAAPLLWL
jgi:hypothetical protein